MKNKIKIALIGCGIVGLRRISILPKQFELIGCSDPFIDLKKINFKKKNLYLTNDWKKLIKIKTLNAVIVSTTHNLQSEIIKECLRKNLHVFVEKPAGVNSKESHEVLKILKNKKKLKVRVGFNHRYHPAFLLAKKIVNQNKIGEIFCIRAIYGHGGRYNYDKEWRFNKKYSGGGELIDKGSHLIDLSRIFLGNLKVDFYKLETFFWKTNLEDNCFLNLKNEKGSTATLHASSTEWKNKFIFEIFGKYGKIEINGLGRSYGLETLTFFKMSKKMGVPKSKHFIFNQNDIFSWKEELKEFYKDIKKNRKPSPSMYDAHENLKIITKIYSRKV